MSRRTNTPLMVLIYAILIIVSFVMIYPFLWMLFGSFKSNYEIINYPLSLLPKKWTVEGWRNIQMLSGNPLMHYFKNSVIIGVGTTAVVVLATSLGGYALYRKKDLPFFRVIEGCFSIALMYPAVLLLIPLYVIVIKMGLYGQGNFWGIILASSTGAWGAALPFFLFRNFFSSVPYELTEAATIDGANEIQLFFRIMVPVMAPVFSTSILISFLTSGSLASCCHAQPGYEHLQPCRDARESQLRSGSRSFDDGSSVYMYYTTCSHSVPHNTEEGHGRHCRWQCQRLIGGWPYGEHGKIL